MIVVRRGSPMAATRTWWVIVMMLVVMVWVMARRRCAMSVMAWVTMVVARLRCRTMRLMLRTARLVTGVVVRLMLRTARFLAVVIMLVAVVVRFCRLVVSV
jgi:hypothetical protein